MVRVSVLVSWTFFFFPNSKHLLSFSEWLPEQHCQRRTPWKATGAHPTFIQGRCQIPECHATPWWALSLHYSQCKLEPILLFFSSTSGYIGEFEIIDDHRSGKIVIQLNGHLNKTGVISPRFNIQHSQIESWVNLLLPARGFGILILVTSFLHFWRTNLWCECVFG